MAEYQGLKSLRFYNWKNGENIFPGVDLAGMDHQQEDDQHQI